MYADAWRSPEFIKHDPLSFSFCSWPEIDVPLFSRKRAEVKVQNRSVRKTAILQGCFSWLFTDNKSTKSTIKRRRRRKKGNSQDSQDLMTVKCWYLSQPFTAHNVGDKTKYKNVGSMCDAIYALPSKNVYFKQDIDMFFKSVFSYEAVPSSIASLLPRWSDFTIIMSFQDVNVVLEYTCTCIQSNTIRGRMHRVC